MSVTTTITAADDIQVHYMFLARYLTVQCMCDLPIASPPAYTMLFARRATSGGKSTKACCRGLKWSPGRVRTLKSKISDTAGELCMQEQFQGWKRCVVVVVAVAVLLSFRCIC